MQDASPLLDSLPDAIVAVDGSCEIIVANEEAGRLFGYAREELVGMLVDQLIAEDLRAAHVGTRAGFVVAPVRRPMGSGLQLKALQSDGSAIDIEISLSPVEVARRTL